jgi:hypothetical protein
VALEPRSPSLITFTTDFGGGWTVGAMKGAVLRVNPRAVIVDISHGVAGMNVLEGAFALAAASRAFPEGTVHVAVVDPGVGMARRGLVIETDRFRFVGPDNGVLTLAAPAPAVKRVFSIEDKRFFEADPSPTFHGRDVFAPVAAHLTLGVDPAEMGPQACDLVALAWPETDRRRGAPGSPSPIQRKPRDEHPGERARGRRARRWVMGGGSAPSGAHLRGVPRGSRSRSWGHGFVRIAVHAVAPASSASRAARCRGLRRGAEPARGG